MLPQPAATPTCICPYTASILRRHIPAQCLHNTFSCLMFTMLLTWLQGRKNLPDDIDISQYVAGGIVVYNLRSRNLRWQTHLDLSTDHTQFLAYIYSAPTLVDINRDGKMEIIVGTSMASCLCLHCQCACDASMCICVAVIWRHIMCFGGLSRSGCLWR